MKVFASKLIYSNLIKTCILTNKSGDIRISAHVNLISKPLFLTLYPIAVVLDSSYLGT